MVLSTYWRDNKVNSIILVTQDFTSFLILILKPTNQPIFVIFEDETAAASLLNLVSRQAAAAAFWLVFDALSLSLL